MRFRLFPRNAGATARHPLTQLRIELLESRVLPSLAPHLLKDINLQPVSSSPANITVVGRIAYFTANDTVHGVELWQTDGTAAGTVLVKDIIPGPSSSYLRDLTNVNGTLFFQANDNVHGRELWRSN